MKAWLCSYDDPDYGYCINFAETEDAASEQAMEELGEDEPVPARRAEEFDQYSPGPVGPEILLQHGWWFNCVWCDHTIRDDGCDNCPASSVPVIQGESVYCNQTCVEEARYERNRQEQSKRAAKAECLKKWPFARVTRAWIGGTGSCECFLNDWDNTAVEFSFAGATVGRNHYCHGCRKTFICKGDLEAFNKLRGHVHLRSVER